MSRDERILIRRTGGPDVLERETIAPTDPGPGEARVRHTAIGVNFIDTYHRSGLYPLDLPSGLGSEGAGVVEAIGPGVDDVAVGDRVAYAMGPLGAYATVRTMPAALLIPLPDGIDDRIAAAALLKGLTVDMLANRCARVAAGQAVLVHAASGGVGSIAVQWLKAIGATVIAHAGTAEKAARTGALGADHALSCPLDDLAGTVRDLTGGEGVAAVLDGVGKASWKASLGSVARRGMIVAYGNASGPGPAIAPLELMAAGSLFLTRPTLMDYTLTADERRTGAGRLFALILSGEVRIEIGLAVPLAEAAGAHEALEGRKTMGSTILIP